MKAMFSHIEINVGDYKKSINFYDLILFPLGWERYVCSESHTSYCDGHMKLILSPVEEKYKSDGFHRKKIGLNHFALSVASKAEVDSFYENVLIKNKIKSLYQDGPEGDSDYYSVLFEDPDRMKLEVVYSLNYTDKKSWPNNLPSDFDLN